MARIGWHIVMLLALLPTGAALRAQIVSDPCASVTDRYEAMLADARKARDNVDRRVLGSQMLPANKQRALAANANYYIRTIMRLQRDYPADMARCRKHVAAMQEPQPRRQQETLPAR